MDFTFCAIDLGITTREKQEILNEIYNVPNDLYHGNEFRGCRMLALYNGGGWIGPRKQGVDTTQGEFVYTPAGQLCPTLQRVCEEKIFPFMEPVGRVNLLRTKADQGLNIHLDTKADEIGTLQHKLRIVLNGQIDKLFFLDKNGNKIFMPRNYDTYILDGSHAHSIDPGSEEKITLCIGSPWHGNPTQEYQNIINDALYSIKVSRPNWVEDSWVDPFFRYSSNQDIKEEHHV
jgi:hypothetical protein